MGASLIIYQAYNPISNRFYIGKTTQPLWVRRKRHAVDAERGNTKSIFHKAIRKYGIAAFEWCVLAHASSNDELNRMEKHWISLVSAAGHSIYNLRPGGTGGSGAGELHPNYGKALPESTRQKISSRLKTYFSSNPNPMLGRTGALAPQFGKPRTDEERRKISLGKKGVPRPDIIGSNNPSARAVICETTGEVFSTVTEAATKYNSDLSSIIKCCRGKVKSVKGRVFHYE